MACLVIVEDDKVTQKILENALARPGLDIFIAEDGMKGLDLIQTKKPDIAFVDMLIPKLHGVDLCKRIRQNSLLKDVKIILMSSVYQFSTFRMEIEDAEADYFINKPLDVAKLLQLVEKIIEPPKD
jgi:two-component system alkaline phosphatase synthesis response regulator PhoP